MFGSQDRFKEIIKTKKSLITILAAVHSLQTYLPVKPFKSQTLTEQQKTITSLKNLISLAQSIRKFSDLMPVSMTDMLEMHEENHLRFTGLNSKDEHLYIDFHQTESEPRNLTTQNEVRIENIHNQALLRYQLIQIKNKTVEMLALLNPIDPHVIFKATEDYTTGYHLLFNCISYILSQSDVVLLSKETSIKLITLQDQASFLNKCAKSDYRKMVATLGDIYKNHMLPERGFSLFSCFQSQNRIEPLTVDESFFAKVVTSLTTPVKTDSEQITLLRDCFKEHCLDSFTPAMRS